MAHHLLISSIGISKNISSSQSYISLYIKYRAQLEQSSKLIV